MTRRTTAEEPNAGQQAATLGFGEAMARLLAFGASLVVARRLGPEAFGVIGVATGVMLYLIQIADQGIELVGVPGIARDGVRARELVAAVLGRRMVGAAILAGVVATVARTILPTPDGRVLAAYAPVLILTGASMRWVLLGLHRPGMIAVSRIIGEAIALAFVFTTVRTTADLLWVPTAAIAGLTVTTAVMAMGARSSGMRLTPSWSWRAGDALFSRGRSLVLFTLLGLVLFNFDLIFLRFVKGERSAGEYAAAYAFISFASNLIVAFAHAVLPTLARTGGAERDGVYGTALARVVGLALPVATAGALLAAPVIALVYGDRFAAGAIALRLLALSLPFAALREVAVVAVIAAGREQALVRVNVITVICNVALNVVLVPAFGLAGAAGATLATEIVRFALAFNAARAMGVRGPLARRYLRPTFATLAMATVLYLTAGAPLWQTVPIGAAAYAAALTVLGALRFRRSALPELNL